MADNNNKIIAIASEEKDFQNGKVSSISGRASYFHLFQNGKLIETIKNPFKIGGGGAGPSVAQMLIDKNVQKVIAGSFGQNFKNYLVENDVEFNEIKDKSIKELLELE